MMMRPLQFFRTLLEESPGSVGSESQDPVALDAGDILTHLPASGIGGEMIESLRELLAEARNITDECATSGEMGRPTTEELAGVALQLAALGNEITEHLEPLKEQLREWCVHERNEGGRATVVGITWERDPNDLQGHEISRALGEVQVTYPSPTLKLRKGHDESLLREKLGDAVFEEAFEVVTQVRLRKGLGDRLRARTAAGGASPTPAEGKASGTLLDVLQYLDMSEPTPRVGFRPEAGIQAALVASDAA